MVHGILREHLPAGFKVWVFGSRANWTTKDSPDLDLAVEGPDALDYKAKAGLEVAFTSSRRDAEIEANLARLGFGEGE